MKSNRQLFGGNEKWLVQCVTLDEGSTCLEAVASGVAVSLLILLPSLTQILLDYIFN